jgi:hypothetical protein
VNSGSPQNVILPPRLKHRVQRSLGLLLLAVAAIELAAAAWVLAFGPFEAYVGPLPIMARDASKPFMVSVLTASLGFWLREPFYPPAQQARLARVSTWLALAAVVIGVVPLAWPIFLPDFLIGHDGGVHQTYAFLLNRALEQGQLPVRWVEGIANGIGQPLFNYYQVGFYYLVALIHRCGPGLSLALKLAIAVVWTAGPLFMFLLCRPLGLMPAALGAAVLGWTPYILLDGYVRTAYPEFTAIALAPGVLWSIDRLLKTGRPVFVCTLGSTTGLLLISHLPAALIVAPVAAAFTIGSSLVHRPEPRRLGLVAAGALLGVGLAAFYVVPAILELDQVQISRLTSAYFDYQQHFVRPEWWIDWSWGYGASGVGAADRLSLQIGIVQWIVIIAGIAVLTVPPFRRRARSQLLPIAGWLAVVALAMFMMTAPSAGLWARITPLAYIQFPWRFLMLPALACAALAAVLLSALPRRTTQALVVLSVVTFQWYVTGDYREMAATRERGEIAIDDPAWRATASARRWAFREAGYNPVSVTDPEPRPLPYERWSLAGGFADVSTVSATDTTVRLTVSAPAPVTLVINSPFFGGWQVRLDDQPVSPTVARDTGYMAVSIPAGRHDVDAVFGRSLIRAVAEIFTVGSIAVLILIVLWPVLRRRSGPRRSSAVS